MAAAVLKAKLPTVFELKSAALTLVAVVLKSIDLWALARELEDSPQLFEHEPVAIDLSQVRDDATPIDFAALVALLRLHRMLPIAVRGGSDAQMQAAIAHGLIEAPADPSPAAPAEPEVVLTEVVRAVQVAAPSAMIVDKPLRSGQQVYAKGSDLVVLAVVSFGAEVIADGNIHVYAPLRGRAIAGARGNADARIFTTCMQPQLVAIAGTYRTTETALPADVLGKPAQVRLVGDKLIVEALKL